MSGNGNHGTVNGASLAIDRNGRAASSYHFDGIDDFIEVPNHSSLQLVNHSLVTWLKVHSSDQRPIIKKDRHIGENYSLNVGYGIFTSQFYGATGAERDKIQTDPINENIYYHLASSYGGGVFKIFSMVYWCGAFRPVQFR